MEVLSSFPPLVSPRRETSEIIARSLDLETEVIAGIHERDFGCLKGHPYERMADKMSLDSRYDPLQAWMWKPEGGESQEEVRLRVGAVLDSLRVTYADRQVVVVCHGAVIQALCAYTAGSWDRANMPPPNCGIVVLEHTPQGWTKTVQSSRTPGRPIPGANWYRFPAIACLPTE